MSLAYMRLTSQLSRYLACVCNDHIRGRRVGLARMRSGREHREDRMAYDEGLAQRIREVLGEQPGLIEKKMFGGVGFMVHGNMACGVHKDALIVRVGP